MIINYYQEKKENSVNDQNATLFGGYLVRDRWSNRLE